MEKSDLDDIRMKLYERLKNSGWADKLKGFLLSSDFEKILNQLHEEVNNGNRFTPPLKQIFRCFEECPYSKLSVLIISQDPHIEEGEADGLAFSCGNTKKLQSSLGYILNEVKATVYNDGPINEDLDLKRWANQGVLLLNTALTTTIGKTGRHYMIWAPFMAYLLDILMCYNPGLIYVLCGKVAQRFSDSISDNNYKFLIEHPTAAAYRKTNTWESKKVFVEINKILLKSNNTQIIW